MCTCVWVRVLALMCVRLYVCALMNRHGLSYLLFEYFAMCKSSLGIFYIIYINIFNSCRVHIRIHMCLLLLLYVDVVYLPSVMTLHLPGTRISKTNNNDIIIYIIHTYKILI